MIDNRTYKLLKRLYRRGKLTLAEIGKLTGHDEKKNPSRNISALTEKGFISFWNGKQTINDLGDREWLGFEITLDGRAYIEQERRTKLNFWLPYTITTVIALLSLAASLADHWEIIIGWITACSPGN